MESIHAHAVLHMMEGNSYTEDSLKEAIIKQFGASQTFHACCGGDMNVDQLIVFLKERGKFMPVDNGFSVDMTKVCDNE